MKIDWQKKVLAAIISTIPLLITSSSALATIVYSETTSGDLPGDQSQPLLIDSFVSGINTILGHDSIGSDIASQGDTFGFNLLNGYHIDSITLRLVNNTNVVDKFSLTIFKSSFTQVNQVVENPGASGSVNFTPFLPQTPGQYNFSTQFVTGTQPSQGFDWQWDIQVSLVPEPGQGALFIAGLFALVLVTPRLRIH